MIIIFYFPKTEKNYSWNWINFLQNVFKLKANESKEDDYELNKLLFKLREKIRFLFETEK